MSVDGALASTAATVSRRGAGRQGIRSGRYSLLYLSPALLIFLVFTIGPAVFVLYISFFDWNLLNTSLSRFVGVDNYRHLFSSSDFWHSIVASVYFVGAVVGGSTVLGLGIALLLSSGGFVRRIVRLAVLTPYFTPLVATSIVWVWIFNPQFGLLDALLRIVHLNAIDWLDTTTWAMPALIVYTLWHDLGFTVIIFLAGLAVVSNELREAARVDGARYRHEIRDVILPQLTQTILFVVVITTIDSLQAFTQIYTMTKGGPLGATTTTGFLLYQESFVFYHTGFGAAIAVVLFIVIALFTLLQLRLQRRQA
ncbi:MAG TPA: sugar ABC transporter permease [Gaiellaceae bacterium]|nr:sugar ABC transporter permease [Gaiellaceae bacterium]